VMHRVMAWQCDHCGKTSIHKGNMKRHESHCYKNPATRACYTCRHSSDTLPEGWRPCEFTEYSGWQMYCEHWEAKLKEDER